MKFSCPQCSAKYQISDDKISGRTAKMKCRSCGNMVPIRAKPSTQSMAAAPVVSAFALASSAGRAPRINPPTTPASLPKTEWHAGIDGVSVGPITLQELETHVKSGTVTAETYVWREGMNGWQVLGEVSALSQLLSSAPQVMAPPSIPAINPATSPIVRSPVLRPTSPRRSARAVGSTAQSLRSSTLSVEPLVQDVVVSEAIPSLLSPAADAVTIPAPEVLPSEQTETPEEPAATGPVALVQPAREALTEAPIPDVAKEAKAEKPLVAPAAVVAPVPVETAPFDLQDDLPRDSLIMQLAKSRRGRWAVPFAVIAAVIFGITMGFVLFGNQKTKIVKQVVEVPAKEQKDKALGEAVSEQSGEELPAEPETVAGKDGPPPKVAGKGSSSPKKKVGVGEGQEPTKIKEGLKGLSGLAGMNGPSSGPGSTGDQKGGGKPLTSSQIQRTVSTYRTSVKRGCWERALMTKDRDAPSSARVTLSISVGSDGVVSRATTGGEPKGYHGLASCISRKVKTWRFPRSSGSTTVNVPFVFAAQ